MSLKNIKSTETFQFSTLAELRRWINIFETTDLNCVHFESDAGDYVSLVWEIEILSDESEVINVRFES